MKAVWEIQPIPRDNLMSRVYTQLRASLCEGRFWPEERLKIRELAAAFQVSDTPMREAIMQLSRERGVIMQPNGSVLVPRLSADQYLELRDIRISLEGMAAEAATAKFDDISIEELAGIHNQLVAAEKAAKWADAVRLNWQFHQEVFHRSGLAEVIHILEQIWLRNGPLINLQYPFAPPRYRAQHQHLHVIEALRSRDVKKVRKAIANDLIEGGAPLVELLRRLDQGELTLEQLRNESAQRRTGHGAAAPLERSNSPHRPTK